MRRVLLSVLLLTLAVPSPAGMIMRGGGGASCASQTYDVENTAGATATNFYNTGEWGQSFVSGVTGSLYSVSFEREGGGSGAADLEVRIGTSADLTSYTASIACTVPDAAGYVECLFDAGSRPSLTASTTYYLGIHITGGATSWPILEGSATYANGDEYFQAASTDWDFTGTEQSYDINFKTRMCD